MGLGLASGPGLGLGEHGPAPGGAGRRAPLRRRAQAGFGQLKGEAPTRRRSRPPPATRKAPACSSPTTGLKREEGHGRRERAEPVEGRRPEAQALSACSPSSSAFTNGPGSWRGHLVSSRSVKSHLREPVAALPGLPSAPQVDAPPPGRR